MEADVVTPEEVKYRVTPEEVKAIMEDYVEAEKLPPFIRTAHNLVNNMLANTFEYSEERLAEIELWLAAHFASSTIYRLPYRREALDTAVAYKMTTSSGLTSTPYGDTALQLDVKGILKDLDKNRIVFNAL